MVIESLPFSKTTLGASPLLNYDEQLHRSVESVCEKAA